MVCGWAPNPFAWSWYIWFEEFYSCILEVRNELHANVMPIAIGCKNFGTWLGIATRVLSHIRALENSVWLCVHTYILLIKETTDHIVLDVCCRRGSILNGKRRPIGNWHLRLAIGSLKYHSHWSPRVFVLPCSYYFLIQLLLISNKPTVTVNWVGFWIETFSDFHGFEQITLYSKSLCWYMCCIPNFG